MTLLDLAASPPVDAASAVGDGEWTWLLIIAGLLLLGGYLIACAVWPFAACRWCGGSGKKRSPSGRAWRPCRRCKATGARVRAGRRLVTVARRTYRAGTRPTRKRPTNWRDSAK